MPSSWGDPMKGKCKCNGVDWICPPIPVIMEPTCPDCNSLIIWKEWE